MLRVLVWPRSMKPREGSTVKPWCCRAATLSRLNSTVCGRDSCWWPGGTRPGGSGSGGPGAQLHLPFQPCPAGCPPHTYDKQGQVGLGLPRQGRLQRCGVGRGSVVTFFGDGWVVRMQPTCSSRVAGGAGVSVSS